MTRQRLFSTLLFLTSMLYVHAQFADPREKFSITADVDGASNTDYYWQTFHPHGYGHRQLLAVWL